MKKMGKKSLEIVEELKMEKSIDKLENLYLNLIKRKK
jgi:hypothetical protein